MLMNKGTISIFLLSAAFSHFCLADDVPHACDYLHLQISNLTKSTCVLASQQVTHGDLISSPPETILPNESKKFIIEQTEYYGPDITLSYECDNEKITFTSQQNLCVLEAGNITATLVEPLPTNIIAKGTSTPGSYWGDQPGMLSWTIKNYS